MTGLSTAAGPRLKAERERRGLSPQKVADELRLDGWIIDALEAEDYERVGPSVFAKGHLKRYATFLELPAAEIMAGYESHVLAPTPAQPANVRLRTDAPAISNLPIPQVLGSVAAVLLALGVLWWKPWHQRGAPPPGQPLAANPRASDGADSPAADGDAAAAQNSPTATDIASLTWTPHAGQSAAAANPAPSVAAESNAAAGMGHARLRLSFSADSWVDVHDAAGRRAFAGNGRANSVRTIAGTAPMRVYLGSASGVQLEINNRAVAIGPQFVIGDAARFEAGADGVLRRDTQGVSPSVPAAATPGPGTQPRNLRPTG